MKGITGTESRVSTTADEEYPYNDLIVMAIAVQLLFCYTVNQGKPIIVRPHLAATTCKHC